MKRLVAIGLLSLLGAASTAHADGSLNVICSNLQSDCYGMKVEFEKATGITVNVVRVSAGEAYAKLRAESRNPKTDIWYGGTNDPHVQAAQEGITLPYESPKLANLQDWAVKYSKDNEYHSVALTIFAAGFTWNEEVLKKKNLEAPKCWADLLKPEYKGEIELANPNSSGTGYTVVMSLVQLMGEDGAFEYMKKLNENVSGYAKSGPAPAMNAARGETSIGIIHLQDAVDIQAQGFPMQYVAPCEGTGYAMGAMSIVKGARNLDNAKKWYDWMLEGKTQELFPKYHGYSFPSAKDATLAKEVVDITGMKLLDKDRASFVSSERRKELIQRWNDEIGSARK